MWKISKIQSFSVLGQREKERFFVGQKERDKSFFNQWETIRV